MQDGPVGFCVVKRAGGLPVEAFAPLQQHRTCDIADAMNGSHAMSGIHPAYRPVRRVVGPATTVSLPGSGFQMLQAAMLQARPGDVLVVSTHSAVEGAFWGGDMTKLAQDLGIAGVVIDGPLRDPDQIAALDFPAFNRSFSTRAAVVEASWGEINMPVACGGVAVCPGDIVVADEHGVVAIPHAWVARAVHDVEMLVSGDPIPPLTSVLDKLLGEGMLVIDES